MKKSTIAAISSQLHPTRRPSLSKSNCTAAAESVALCETFFVNPVEKVCRFLSGSISAILAVFTSCLSTPAALMLSSVP
jgi:hypothetical protein